MGAQLRLEGKSTKQPNKLQPADMRGDAVIYLWNKADVSNALGYHDKYNSGVPFGFVFTELAKQMGENWTVTFSHEALETIADPETNLLAAGPHPTIPNRTVFHWYEMCDAVQDETYLIDNVEVSNFVLPLYFTSSDEMGGRNDFLGRIHAGKTLKSFGVNPGGYIGFFDPVAGATDTYMGRDAGRAQARMAIKNKAKFARRAARYASLTAGQPVAAKRPAAPVRTNGRAQGTVPRKVLAGRR